MNWFQRHLNWTWVFGFLLTLVLMTVVVVVIELVALIVGGEAAGVERLMVDQLEDAVQKLVGGVIMLVVSGWVIRQKGRSLWWLLLSGLFSPLWLENRSPKMLEPSK